MTRLAPVLLGSVDCILDFGEAVARGVISYPGSSVPRKTSADQRLAVAFGAS